VLGKFNYYHIVFFKKIYFYIKRWGNSQVNTTTKPLFEETLNIVFECFDKYKHNRPLLPIECLKNYQLIYTENNDAENLERDDNQVFTERTAARYSIRDLPSRSSSRILPRINTSRASTTTDTSATSDIILPIVIEPDSIKNFDPIEPKEIIKSIDNETEKERLMRLKAIKAKYTFRFPTRSLEQLNNIGMKRSFSSAYAFSSLQRKKRIDLKPISLNKKRNKQQKNLKRTCTDIGKIENTMIIEEDEQEQQNSLNIPTMTIEQSLDGNSSTLSAV
jgi:hypothetical protein